MFFNKKFLFNLLLFLGFITLSSRILALNSSVTKIQKPHFWDMIQNLPEDWEIWSNQTFNKKNKWNLIGITALTWALVQTDYETWQWSSKLKKSNSFQNNLHGHFSSAVDGYFHLILAG